MTKFLFIYFLTGIAWASLLPAQNLVPNGSFEKYFDCPASYVTYYRQQYVQFWDSPNPGTPDYFNACSEKCGVPANWVGYSDAADGEAYMGIIACLYQSDPNQIAYREYIRTQLETPLIEGQEYIASVKIKLAQSCNIACNGLGLFLSKNDLSTRVKHNYPVTPDIVYQGNKIITESENWTEVCGTFIAEGGEEFLIIGNFLSNQEMEYTLFDENLLSTVNISPMAYYYVDDVQVMPYDSILHSDCKTELIPEKELAFTGILPEKGKLLLANLYFEVDESEILPASYDELNKLALELKRNHKLFIEIHGHTDNTGTDDYNQKLSEDRAKAVKYYLMKKGVSQFRIKTRGFGSSQPKSNNTSEEGKSINRRVEIEINTLN